MQYVNYTVFAVWYSMFPTQLIEDLYTRYTLFRDLSKGG
jgi:hypothetical protein